MYLLKYQLLKYVKIEILFTRRNFSVTRIKHVNDVEEFLKLLLELEILLSKLRKCAPFVKITEF